MFASPFQAYILLKASFILIASFLKKPLNIRMTLKLYLYSLRILSKRLLESEAKVENIILLKRKTKKY